MGSIRIPVANHDIVGIRAANPGPFTLSGTNSWLIGRAPTWLVDPGPDLAEHVAALDEEIGQRGGLGGIARSVIGPLEAVFTPGHARDHLAFICGAAALTGDAVLGEGSVFVAPYPGALRAYLDGIERLRRREASGDS